MDSANEHDGTDEVFDRKLNILNPIFSKSNLLCLSAAYAIDLVTSKVYDRRIIMHADFE